MRSKRTRVKRKPLLADRLLATPQSLLLPNKFHETNRQSLMLAKRFVLDEAATTYIGEMVRDVPRIVADAQDFAIPPFKRMWVEFPVALLNKVIGGPTTSLYMGEEKADAVVGYLFNGPSVRIASANNVPGHTPQFTPFEYMIHHPYKDVAEELQVCKQLGVSRGTLDAVFWGSAANQFIAEGDRASMRALREYHSVWPIELNKSVGKDPREVYAYLLNMAGGELRNIISILLFLNRTQDIQKTFSVPGEQGFIGNKLRPFLSHNVISISVNPMPRFLSMVAGEGVWRRLHDVRGHFCHNKVARESGCMHPDWQETDGDGLQWRCTACGGLRWWRKEHRRGHEDKGVVTSEYRVGV
jgi:hypothetical protein